MAQKKMGRPLSENPLKNRIFVLVSDDTRYKLEKCREVLGASISEVVRKGIDEVYDSLNKK